MRKEKPGRTTPSYAGAAGQLAVMGQFAFRGYNVAIPVVDIGHDILVSNDKDGSFWRIQTKMAGENPRSQSSISFSVHVKRSAIDVISTNPPLYYVFVLGLHTGWRFLVFRDNTLRTYVKDGAGTEIKKDGVAYKNFCIYYQNTGRVLCSKQVWTAHLDDWASWPNLRK